MPGKMQEEILNLLFQNNTRSHLDDRELARAISYLSQKKDIMPRPDIFFMVPRDKIELPTRGFSDRINFSSYFWFLLELFGTERNRRRFHPDTFLKCPSRKAKISYLSVTCDMSDIRLWFGYWYLL